MLPQQHARLRPGIYSGVHNMLAAARQGYRTYGQFCFKDDILGTSRRLPQRPGPRRCQRRTDGRKDLSVISHGNRGGYQAPPLMIALDRVEWDERPVRQIAASVRLARPRCLRVANFFTRTLEVLNELDEPQIVLWKLEFWGTDTRYEHVPRSKGTDPDLYVKRILSTGHRVIPYTFNEWGRDRLRALAPELNQHAVEFVPIAQKAPVDGHGREAVRRAIGLAPGQTLVGCGGLLVPAKGIEEIVESFLANFPDPDAHLLCSLIIEEDKETAEQVAQRWARRFGEARMRRVHVRTGPYGDWQWMCDFYRSIDLMLVNSVGDSWGRMVSEALGAGVPAILRRADCGTNHIAPGTVFVDSFQELSTEGYREAIHQAESVSQELSEFVNTTYSLQRTRDRLLLAMRRNLPEWQRPPFDELAANLALARRLDEFTVY